MHDTGQPAVSRQTIHRTIKIGQIGNVADHARRQDRIALSQPGDEVSGVLLLPMRKQCDSTCAATGQPFSRQPTQAAQPARYHVPAVTSQAVFIQRGSGKTVWL